ncbi:MAG: hypothetical protein FWG73_06000 [Planctomycetaceae bacterium]|nr:hypothetical protein [Planctomycetaceae bacterium]
MKDIGEGTIRRIDWTELTPVVLLLRVFNIALGIRVLLLALIGLKLTVFLNFLAGISFLDTELAEQIRQGRPQYYINFPVDQLYSGALSLYSNVLDTPLSPRENPKMFFWYPGVVLIWVIFGGMICRIVSVRLTIDESESFGNLFRFLRKRGISFISAPLLVLLGILCCFLPVKIAGWLLAIPFLNYVVAILFPIPFAFTCLTVFLALVLAVGFMLLFAAVSTDGSDGFDAISRMFSYVCQRPLHYVVYWLCCYALGWLGFLLIQFPVYFAMELCWQTVPADYELFIIFWATLFALIPLAFWFAWFWTSSVAIYLLLRRSVDATPLSEVYRVAELQVRTLPTIKPDGRGAPEIVSSDPARST